MKTSIILLTVALFGITLPALAVKLPESLNNTLSESKEKLGLDENALISFAAAQLGMSEEKVTAGLGALFKVAQDNLSKENFSVLSKSVPDMNNYIKQAPEFSTSAITSLLGDNKDSITAQSAGYLDAAFEKLGIPKESIPTMVSTAASYLETNGYGEAAGYLKKGLSFL